MADPLTWAIIAAGTAAAGSIQQGRQANAAAKSEANMAEYNSKVAEIQATQSYAAASVQEDETRRRGRIAIGNQLASSAEAGAGLNGDLLRESIFGVESDSMAIRYEGDLKAQGLKDTATLQKSAAVVARDRGKQAVTASYLNAASSIANAGSTYSGNQAKINAAKKVP